MKQIIIQYDVVSNILKIVGNNKSEKGNTEIVFNFPKGRWSEFNFVVHFKSLTKEEYVPLKGVVCSVPSKFTISDLLNVAIYKQDENGNIDRTNYVIIRQE